MSISERKELLEFIKKIENPFPKIGPSHKEMLNNLGPLYASMDDNAYTNMEREKAYAIGVLQDQIQFMESHPNTIRVLQWGEKPIRLSFKEMIPYEDQQLKDGQELYYEICELIGGWEGKVNLSFSVEEQRWVKNERIKVPIGFWKPFRKKDLRKMSPEEIEHHNVNIVTE